MDSFYFKVDEIMKYIGYFTSVVIIFLACWQIPVKKVKEGKVLGVKCTSILCILFDIFKNIICHKTNITVEVE